MAKRTVNGLGAKVKLDKDEVAALIKRKGVEREKQLKKAKAELALAERAKQLSEEANAKPTPPAKPKRSRRKKVEKPDIVIEETDPEF